MLAQFLIRLICGMTLMLALLPRKPVASGFFRVQMLIVLGLGVLASLAAFGMNGQPSPTPVESVPPRLSPAIASALVGYASIAIAVLAFVGSVLWMLERRKGGGRVLWIILILAALCLAVPTLVPAVSGDILSRGTLIFLSQLSSAAVLGGAMTGMLLGHSYLTAPTMSIAPLSRLNSQFGAAAACRGVLSAAVLILARDQIVGMTPLMWLSLRWLAGILGPLGVCVMTERILRYRNTQAATGVLFVGVILTFIGELTGDLLLHELGYPY